MMPPACFKPLLGAALMFAGCLSAQAMSLSEALQRAVEQDPLEAVSASLYRAQRELGNQERSSLLPSVGANATGGYSRTDSEGFLFSYRETYPSWSASVEARQPLFRLDWSARRMRAQAQDELAELGLEGRRLDLLGRVAQRYFAVLSAQDALTQAEAEAAAVRKALDATRNRHEAEMAPGTDLKEAQARSDLAQAALLSARRQLLDARDALDETTGNGQAELPRLQTDWVFPALTPALVDDWLKVAEESSPTIEAAKQQVRVAEANYRSRVADQAPTVDLVATASHDDSAENPFGQKLDDTSVQLQLNVPLYSGGLNSSRIRESEARLAAAQADARRISLESLRQTRQLFREVDTAYAEVAAYRRALESARAAERATQNGYEAGTRTITDTLDALSSRVQAERNLNQARYNLLLGILELKRVVGVLDESDFREIDRLMTSGAP